MGSPLGLLDAAKVETKYPIATLDDIYEYAEQIRAGVRRLGDSGIV
jgi:ABC-type glycerol-3-phosphate transport system substrate-binding protein